MAMVHPELVSGNNISAQCALRCGGFGVQLSQFAGGDIQYTRQLFTISQRHIGLYVLRTICQTRSE